MSAEWSAYGCTCTYGNKWIYPSTSVYNTVNYWRGYLSQPSFITKIRIYMATAFSFPRYMKIMVDDQLCGIYDYPNMIYDQPGGTGW